MALPICAPARGARGPPAPHRPQRIAICPHGFPVLIYSSCSSGDLAPVGPLVVTLTAASFPRPAAAGDCPSYGLRRSGGLRGTRNSVGDKLPFLRHSLTLSRTPCFWCCFFFLSCPRGLRGVTRQAHMRYRSHGAQTRVLLPARTGSLRGRALHLVRIETTHWPAAWLRTF